MLLSSLSFIIRELYNFPLETSTLSHYSYWRVKNYMTEFSQPLLFRWSLAAIGKARVQEKVGMAHQTPDNKKKRKRDVMQAKSPRSKYICQTAAIIGINRTTRKKSNKIGSDNFQDFNHSFCSKAT